MPLSDEETVLLGTLGMSIEVDRKQADVFFRNMPKEQATRIISGMMISFSEASPKLHTAPSDVWRILCSFAFYGMSIAYRDYLRSKNNETQ